MGRQMSRVAPSDGPPCVGRQGQSDQVLGFPNWNRAHDTVRILLFLAVQDKYVDMMPPSTSTKNTIQALAWRQYGNLLTSVSRDQTVGVFNIRSMEEWVVLRRHKGVLRTVYLV